MPASPQARENLLLYSLPADVRDRLAPDLREVTLPVGRVLHEPGAPMHDAYFPTTSVVSELYMMESGESAEVALVGHEGMIGVSLFLGSEQAMSRAVVQSAGHGITLPARVLRDEFERAGSMMHTLLRYTQFFITQTVQTAACNRHGTLEQRLCRWILQSLDRAPSCELAMTHEGVANALGATRAAVSEAAARLRDQGAIRYHRGLVCVLDRRVLERRVCECYKTIKRQAAPATTG